MATANVTGTFPRMRDKKSSSYRPLTSIKSASTWNLCHEGKNKPLKVLKSVSSASNLLDPDFISLRPSSSIFDTFGISDGGNNQLVPSLEQAWRDIFATNNNNTKRLTGVKDGEPGCIMTPSNLFEETLKNCSVNNAALKQKLALALELQNAMYTLG